MAENIKIPVVKCNAEVVAMGLVSGNVQEMPSHGNMKENIFLTVVITCKTSLYIVSDLFVNYDRFLALSSPPTCSQLSGVVVKRLRKRSVH